MALVAYATTEQLTAWVGDSVTVPSDADRQLVRASELLDSYIRTPYTVDTDGLPTDTDVATVLADATCAQVEQWIETGESNDIDGLAGAQVGVAGYSGARAPELAPRARRILASNGLAPATIGAYPAVLA